MRFIRDIIFEKRGAKPAPAPVVGVDDLTDTPPPMPVQATIPYPYAPKSAPIPTVEPWPETASLFAEDDPADYDDSAADLDFDADFDAAFAAAAEALAVEPETAEETASAEAATPDQDARPPVQRLMLEPHSMTKAASVPVLEDMSADDLAEDSAADLADDLADDLAPDLPGQMPADAAPSLEPVAVQVVKSATTPSAAEPAPAVVQISPFERLRRMEAQRSAERMDLREKTRPKTAPLEEARIRSALTAAPVAPHDMSPQPVAAQPAAPSPAPLQPAPRPLVEATKAPTLEDMPFVTVGQTDALAPLGHMQVPPPAAGRSGRVKTRLLGFNPDAMGLSDPFQKPKSADTPSFPVAWIVVVAGPGRGAAFALQDGVSRIGRSEDQDVALNFGDNAISRENHVSIAYDAEQSQFFIGQSGRANIVRLNNKPLLSTETLQSGDQIRVGETTLRFVALCGEAFSWANSTGPAARHG